MKFVYIKDLDMIFELIGLMGTYTLIVDSSEVIGKLTFKKPIAYHMKNEEILILK